ncbi:peptide ligase PGM1-related protein [Streptomyces mirabilis]
MWEHRLAFDPARGEGVVLYVDAPSDGRSLALRGDLCQR